MKTYANKGFRQYFINTLYVSRSKLKIVILRIGFSDGVGEDVVNREALLLKVEFFKESIVNSPLCVIKASRSSLKTSTIKIGKKVELKNFFSGENCINILCGSNSHKIPNGYTLKGIESCYTNQTIFSCVSLYKMKIRTQSSSAEESRMEVMGKINVIRNLDNLCIKKKRNGNNWD